jgi:hypothetical protein
MSSRAGSGSPFGTDDDYTENSEMSFVSTFSRGYRDGGPKEARLFRVALLSKLKDTDNMFPIKVENIPQHTTEEVLKEIFSSFGEIGDVYIPKDTKNQPLSNFAVVRFLSAGARDLALAQEVTVPEKSNLRKKKSLSLSPLKSQRSFFSKGTGYHGICNVPVEEGYDRSHLHVEQDISLSSCRSRSGYPWGSVRELKTLAPHPPQEAIFSYALRVDDLPRSVT